MGAFKNMGSVKRGFKSNPIKAEDADYVVRIDKAVYFEAETSGDTVKLSVTILAADQGSHKIGELVDVFYGVPQTPKGQLVFQQNVMTLLCDLSGQTEETFDTEAKVLAILTEGGELEGQVARLRVRMKATKNKDDKNPEQFRQRKDFAWSQVLSVGEIVAAIGEEAVAQFFPSGL